MTVEQWLPVPGREGEYEVSNHGRVRSVDRVVSRAGISGNFRRKGKILSATFDGCGYPKVALGRGHQHKVHRLVALAFIPNPGELPEIDHRDADKMNCRVENLSWCSHYENSVRRHALGYKTCSAKFSSEQKAAVVAALAAGEALMHVAARFGMSRSHARRLRDTARGQA